jgi:hypothetical protein
VTPPPVDPDIVLPWEEQSPPDASTLTVEPLACVPVRSRPAGPRSPGPCEVRTLRPDGTLARRERFDAQGHRTEEAVHARDGRVSWRRVDTWEQGRQVRSALESASGEWSQSEWFYDEVGRPVRHLSRANPPHQEREVLTRYDALGRIARVEERRGGALPWLHEYVYGGEEGRLEAVLLRHAEDDVPSTLERHLYHPNGQLRRVEVTPPTIGGGETREYDEAGRLVRSESSSHNSSWGSSRAYGARGELVRLQGHHGGVSASVLWDEVRVYDAKGREVAKASVEDVREHAGVVPRHYQRRQVLRRTLACETGTLLGEELDQRADGTPDGWHTLEYDAAGNLRAERFSGTMANSELGWREYDYRCH